MAFDGPVAITSLLFVFWKSVVLGAVGSPAIGRSGIGAGKVDGWGALCAGVGEGTEGLWSSLCAGGGEVRRNLAIIQKARAIPSAESRAYSRIDVVEVSTGSRWLSPFSKR